MKFLQGIYISWLSPWIPFVGKISEKIKYRVITACFIADLILFCIVRYGLHKESYFYNTALGIVLMLVVAIFSLDKKLEKKRWHRSMIISWYGMCICFIVSDVLVTKKVCGLGLVLAILFPMVFLVWQNHSRKYLLWKCFKDAIKLSFWLMAIVSFLFRPLYEGGRYAGIFTNPNTFALYLCVIFAVFMSDLDWIVDTGKKITKSILTHISLALIVFYLLLSQARTSIIAVAAVFMMWMVLRIIFAKKTHSWKNMLKNTVAVIVFTVVLYPVFLFGVNHIPQLIGHPIVFAGETLYLSDGTKIEDFGETVVAESVGVESTNVTPEKGSKDEAALKGKVLTDSQKKEMIPQNVLERFFYILENTKGLNALTSGRIDIYKGYAKKINFKGHKNVALVINGKKKQHAHNNWLQFGYTYGIISMFFYGIITVLALVFSIRFYLTNRRKNATYAFLVPAICVSFVIATMAECLFLPFEVFPAFAFWFVFGDLFEKGETA